MNPPLKNMGKKTNDIEIGDFGKTVFLTHEEAEAALEEMKNG